MKTRSQLNLSIAGASLALGLLAGASAQTDPTPPGTPPKNPGKPGSPPGTQPPTQTPGASARPQGTEDVTAAITEDTIQFYKDADYKDAVTQLDGVTKSNKGGQALDLQQGLEDSLTAMRWNLPPGVVVVLYEDDGGKGEQFAIWGKGQTPSIAKFDFDNKASQWAWFYVGGVTNPAPHLRSAQSSSPLGAEHASGEVADNSLQLFKSKDFAANEAMVSNVTSQPAGKLNTLPQDLPDSLTSLRWNLPPGVVVVFYQDSSGLKQQAAIWGNGQIADIDVWDFNDKVSRWAWYNVAGTTTPSTTPPPSRPPTTPPPSNPPGTGNPR
jgi:hypothetical protein